MTLDQMLYALRLSDLDYRTTCQPPEDVEERMYACCPVCSIPHALELVEVERDCQVQFFCWTGCSEFEIHRGLRLDVHLALKEAA